MIVWILAAVLVPVAVVELALVRWAFWNLDRRAARLAEVLAGRDVAENIYWHLYRADEMEAAMLISFARADDRLLERLGVALATDPPHLSVVA